MPIDRVERLRVVPLSRVVSREGTQGNWAPRNAFAVKECGVVVGLLTLPSIAVIRIFEYL